MHINRMIMVPKMFSVRNLNVLVTAHVNNMSLKGKKYMLYLYLYPFQQNTQVVYFTKPILKSESHVTLR